MDQSEYVRKLVDSAPPLSESQRNAISYLLGAPRDMDEFGMPDLPAGGAVDRDDHESVDNGPLAV